MFSLILGRVVLFLLLMLFQGVVAVAYAVPKGVLLLHKLFQDVLLLLKLFQDVAGVV